jgi:hypothetical protein
LARAIEALLLSGRAWLRSLAMPLTADQRRARGQLAAMRRHHPDEELPPEAAELDRAALDKHIDEVVARAQRMTPEQADRLRRLFRYAPAE